MTRLRRGGACLEDLLQLRDIRRDRCGSFRAIAHRVELAPNTQKSLARRPERILQGPRTVSRQPRTRNAAVANRGIATTRRRAEPEKRHVARDLPPAWDARYVRFTQTRGGAPRDLIEARSDHRAGPQGSSGEQGPRAFQGPAADTFDLEVKLDRLSNRVSDLEDQFGYADVGSAVDDLIFTTDDLDFRLSQVERDVSDICFELDLFC
jgi:hypothetical protein